MKIIINNKIVFLKTTAILKLNLFIRDLKEKSAMDYDDIDKLCMIYNDLDEYMKHLKKDVGSIKTIIKTISANQTDSHQSLMKLLN